ncbi:DUF229 domain containing protein [Trichuris trichiura]|uniref:DUF229 domain containing protein n=1 Tax=Trichuris trichiura TaxID=36087 RepID=A0A077Z4Z7_TRITR|nr:DUF229 domain containing protein [Trichuris trichiura]
MLFKRTSSSKRRKTLLVRCVVAALVIFAAAQLWANLNEFVQPSFFYVPPALYSKACKAPQIDPWDPLVLPYYKKLPPLICKRFQPELTYVDNSGRLMLNSSQVNEALPETGEMLQCEFVETACQKGILPVSFYTNFHNHIIRVPASPRVLLFLIDSMSRSNFVRCMPKLFNVLSSEYKSIMFDSFNKVGDNSFPNGIAMLTGRRVEGVQELPTDMRNRFYDDWPIVWKEYAKKGYATLFDGNGFRAKPTDHYYRPFMNRMFYSFLHLRSKHLCVGNNPTHNYQLNYVKHFLRQYNGRRPVFGLNWQTEISHDWINQVQLADEDFANFFRQIREYTSNVVLFVLSDHGQRFGSIRHTVVGRMEENTPVFIVALPKQVAIDHPALVDTLERNAKLLATHYDLHATLLHLLDHSTWKSLERTSKENAYSIGPLPRGLSLFRPLPNDRSCQQAEIPEEYCTCGQQVTINASTELAKKSAQFVVDYLNRQLEKLEPGRCATLRLTKVLSAYAFLPGIKVRSNFWIPTHSSSSLSLSTTTYADYLVTIEATPGGGHFEAVLRQRPADDQLSIVGQISRINKYGNQSRCAVSADMRKYCYCLNSTSSLVA